MHKAIIGKMAPKFQAEAVFEEDFMDVGLENYLGKYVILLFYVRDFTPLCLSEVKAFSEKFEEFEKHNCQLLAISTDSKYTHLAWSSTGPASHANEGTGTLRMPLLSDHDHTISRHYGVLTPEGHAQRSTFIIDKNGDLKQASFYETNVCRSVAETLRLLQAIQYAENGSGAPVDYVP